MFAKLAGWFIQKKLKDVNGEEFYGSISITKVCIVLMGVLKFGVEGLGGYLFAQGIVHQHIEIPAFVYELIASVGGIAARNALVHNTPEANKDAAEATAETLGK